MMKINEFFAIVEGLAEDHNSGISERLPEHCRFEGVQRGGVQSADWSSSLFGPLYEPVFLRVVGCHSAIILVLAHSCQRHLLNPPTMMCAHCYVVRTEAHNSANFRVRSYYKYDEKVTVNSSPIMVFNATTTSTTQLIVTPTTLMPAKPNWQKWGYDNAQDCATFKQPSRLRTFCATNNYAS